MQVQAARADLRRGKSRGTRAKDHSMLHHATQETHLEGQENQVRCRGTLEPMHELRSAT